MHPSYLSLALLVLLPLQTVVSKVFNDEHKNSSFKVHKHRQRDCLELPLADRIQQVEFVFTGTVRALETDPSSPATNIATVEVKRYFKIAQGLDDLATRTVSLHGVGDDSRLCISNTVLRDSWIFLANRYAQPANEVDGRAPASGLQVQLNSSLIKLTLANIDEVDGLVQRSEVKMQPIRVRSPIARSPPTTRLSSQPTSTPDPCSSMTCAHGSYCVTNDDRTAQCRCPVMLCDDETTTGHVCGSDRKDYKNECSMNAASCQEQRSIVKLYNGHCDSCKDKQCDYNGVCVADNRGGSECVCPTEKSCYEQTDGREIAVCGSDGELYASECQMQVTSCQRKANITVAPLVVCDRCAGVECKRRGEICVEGECKCRSLCPANYDPVCGTDSVTYPNQCKLDEVACSDHRNISTAHTGACIDEGFGSGDFSDLPAAADGQEVYQKQAVDETPPHSYPTSTVRCDDSQCSYGAICEAVGHQQIHRCVCRFACEAIRSAVCGSDGNIYTSECQLKETACHKQKEITVQSMGNCEDLDMESEQCDGRPPLVNRQTGDQYNCDREMCPAGSYCHRLQSMVSRCCPATDDTNKGCESSEYGCCSDGITAAPGPHQAGCPEKCQCNALGSIEMTCDPKSRHCRCKTGVRGQACDQCETTFWGMHLIRDANSGCIPCGCNVFGSEREDCDQMTGRCVCQPGMRGHKCNICPNNAHVGSQGCVGLHLMQNDHVHNKALHRDQRTSVGPVTCRRRCSYGAVCDVTSGSRFARCKCPTECTDGERAVCGTDGRTYGSVCLMKLHGCRRRQLINVVHPGLC